MLPLPEEFSRSMAELGVSDAMDIVIYEQDGVFSAPRAWWMLRTFGARNVFLLDGGLRAWIAAGLPTESGEVHSAAASFHARFNPDAVRGFEQIEQLIAERGQILDAGWTWSILRRVAGTAARAQLGPYAGSGECSLH